MPPTLECQQRMSTLREKARTSELTLEECQEAIVFLRGERLAMAPAKNSSRSKAPPPNADDLLGELGL